MALLAIIVAGTVGRASPICAAEEPENAALHYWAAFALCPPETETGTQNPNISSFDVAADIFTNKLDALPGCSSNSMSYNKSLVARVVIWGRP